MPPHIVVIIGAGFSGAMTAAHLLRRAAAPLRVLLVNRGGPMARGVAYGTHSDRHVLNVPAGNMSAFADDPSHFLRFAQERDPSVTGGTFAPRRLYGEYLEAVLHEAESAAAPGVALERVADEATSVLPVAGGARAVVRFAGGRSVEADRVVLALGNYAPADPPVPDEGVLGTARYVRDPWAPRALDVVARGERVLLFGTGLTMLDVAVELRARGARAPMLALSRRGLVPQPHRSPSTAPQREHRPPGIETGDATALAYLRAVRAQVRRLAEQGIDWRDVVGSLRPITPALWQRLPRRERARFLRHVRPYWEVHRHRAAPEAAAALHEMLATGVVRRVAGRLLRLEPAPAGAVVAHYQPRGAAAAETVVVDRVVNCTGPEGDTRALRDPLVAALRDAGLFTPDALGLGAEVSPDGALVNREGRPSWLLFHIGPFLRAGHWEATAVPELRIFAARLGESLAASFAASFAASPAPSPATTEPERQGVPHPAY